MTKKRSLGFLPRAYALYGLNRFKVKVGDADESLISLQGARQLAEANACDVFNVRLSKCGGSILSEEMIRLAAESQIEFGIGAMVGETGILSRAGTHLGAIQPGFRYIQGYSHQILHKTNLGPGAARAWLGRPIAAGKRAGPRGRTGREKTGGVRAGKGYGPAMSKYNVVILAAGKGGPLEEETGIAYKAMIPIHGKTMLDWVVEAYADAEPVGHIVVVGPKELDDLPCMARTRKRLSPAMDLFQNLVMSTAYVKHRLYESAGQHQGYLIGYGDAAFLRGEIVEDTLRMFSESDADISLVYVEKGSFDKAGLSAKRTYIPVQDKHYTGGVMCYIKKMRIIYPALGRLAEMRKVRKNATGILEELGCLGKGFEEIEKAIGEMLSCTIKIHVSPHPEIGMDVDKPSDLALARQWLAPAAGGKDDHSD